MKFHIFILASFVVGIAVGFMLGKSDLSSIPNMLPLSCSYNNQTYKNGESFKDDCNTCSCQNGQVACTLMACRANPF